MRFHASPVTCTMDGLAHLISDDAAAAGITAGRGIYTALCGYSVHAAAMVSSAGQPCPRCTVYFEAHCAEESPKPLSGRSRRRSRTGRNRFRRLLKQPSDLDRLTLIQPRCPG